MPWTWIRPSDHRPLEERPLVDLGVGDAQTLMSLVDAGRGPVVGIDRSVRTLRAARASISGETHLVAGDAEALPLLPGSVRVVLAGDLFHHLDDRGLSITLRQVHRVLEGGGRLLAWWWTEAGTPAPDAPRHARPYDVVERAALDAGFGRVDPLELETTTDAGPPSAGLEAER